MSLPRVLIAEPDRHSIRRRRVGRPGRVQGLRIDHRDRGQLLDDQLLDDVLVHGDVLLGLVQRHVVPGQQGDDLVPVVLQA